MAWEKILKSLLITVRLFINNLCMLKTNNKTVIGKSLFIKTFKIDFLFTLQSTVSVKKNTGITFGNI